MSQRNVVTPERGRKAPLSFHPHETQARLAVSAAKIKFYRSKQLLTELSAAIDELIKEQAMFVRWWDNTVRPPGRVPQKVQSGTFLKMPEAEKMTGISHVQVSRWRQRAVENPEKYREHLLGYGANHRANGTGQNEWFTPGEYIELVRQTLGEIDLDPASHPIAQRRIRAKKYFTEADDALQHEWHGRVWLNPPYARDLIARFAEKLMEEFGAGRTTAAVVLTHAYTDTSWFQALASGAAAICFVRGRIRFVDIDNDPCDPTQGQAFFYFGPDHASFVTHFSALGFIVRRI